MKRFSAYLFREIIPLYLAGFISLALLLLVVVFLDVVAEVIARGAAPNLVASFLILSLPEAIRLAIPLALLFATLLAFSRLGQDGEIKAALLLGLSPNHFAGPVLTLGILITLVSVANNELLIPWSSQQALEVQKEMLLKSPEILLEEGSFFTDGLGRSVYIENLMPGGRVEGITVIQAGGIRGPREVVRAAQGQLDEEAGLWRLDEVEFVKFEQSQAVLIATAKTGTLPVRKLAAASREEPELTSLPMRELWRRLQEDDRDNFDAWTAMHRKFAEPAAAIAFAFFALAIGLYSFRNNLNIGFVAVLFMTFLYYASWSVANVLGAQGTVPSWLAGWAPVGLYFITGSILFLLSWRR